MTKQIENQNSKCKNCGANLVYDVDTAGLICHNCGSRVPIKASKNYPKHSFDKLEVDQSSYNEWKTSNKVFKCENCGSSVSLNPLEITTVCPYCSSALVCSPSALPGLKPDSIIPFKFSKQKAPEIFLSTVKKKWFLPNKFKKMLPTSQNIVGIYIPSFAFDARTSSKYKGVLEITETVHTVNGIETKTSHERISGVKDVDFKNIMIEASSHISQNRFDDINSYNLAELVDFDDEFLRGYCVECYDNDVINCYSIAKKKMDSRIRSEILKQYHYSSVESLTVSTIYSRRMFNYMLLPSYEFKYFYKDQQYTVYINGQTGKIGGEFPRSSIKITFFILGIVLGVIALLILGLILH